MAEEAHILLSRVGQVFPVGTVVGLYPGLVPDAGVPRPVGVAVTNAVVSAEESLDFGTIAVTQRTYWAAAQVGGLWRSIQATVKAGETPSVIAAGERGPKGDKGDTGGAILGAEQVETSNLHEFAVTTSKLGAFSVTIAKIEAGAVIESKLGESAVSESKIKALAVTAAKLAAESVTEEKLAAAVKAKLNVPQASSPLLYGWIGSAVVAGVRSLPMVAAELVAGSGSLEAPKAMIHLRAGVKYKVQVLTATGATAPAVALSVILRKVSELAPFGVTPDKTLLTTAKLATVEVTKFSEAEFEAESTGWYQVGIVTSETTAVSSKVGIGVSIGQ